MTAEQFRSSRRTLGWTHQHLADVLGVHRRTSQRYSKGKVIPVSVARLLLLLVRLRLTIDANKFEEIIDELANAA